MASKTLFRSILGKLLPVTNAVNEAGGCAYALSEKQALAQYATSGCLNGTFYASDEEQLSTVSTLCRTLEPEFIARATLYARCQGNMKDMPALLTAMLSVRGPGLMAEIFDRVIDSPKMLRNFVQIMRSGVVGRKSLGTLPKRLILQWLERRTDEQLFHGSVGNDPSLADIVKMVHPKPATASRKALYGWLIGREYDASALPKSVREFERFKRADAQERGAPPSVPFQMLTSLSLEERDWQTIARNAPWQMTRMNLNTFLRHGVFRDQALTREIANRLRNPQAIKQAQVFPYQLLAAYLNASHEIPADVRDALQDAMELSIGNVPLASGKIYVCTDVSGSMHSPITGHRAGATTKMRCIDVAALVAAAVMRRNPTAEVVPFESNVVSCRLNPRDSVMTNAQKLASLPAGGTNCSAPLAHLNQRRAVGDLVIYVSDNESWIDTPTYGRCGGSATETMRQWNVFQSRNPQAKMICIDLQPSATTQAAERPDIINVGGFGDQVFSLIAAVAGGEFTAEHQVREIERMRI